MTEVSHQIDGLSLSLTNSGVFFLSALILASAAFAIWYYTGTVPEVHGWEKKGLIALRAGALILCAVGFSEPVLEIIMTRIHQENVAVLIDTSSSMSEKNDPSRKNRAIETVNSVRAKLGDSAEYFAFDTQVRDIDPLRDLDTAFTGAATNILDAVNDIYHRKNISSIILISDGRWNIGEDPSGAELNIETPIHTVLAGSETVKKDVSLRELSFAPVGRSNTLLPVEIILGSTTDNSGPVTVNITEDARQIVSGTTSFNGGVNARTTLYIPLSESGDYIYVATISTDDDFLLENNSREFRVRVVKDVYRILLAASSPSPDFGFISRVLKGTDDFDVYTYIAKGVAASAFNAFPSDLSSFDAVVILNGEGMPIPPDRIDSLVTQVMSGCGLYLLGSSPPNELMAPLYAILPVTFSRKVIKPETGVPLEITDDGHNHFVSTGVQNPGAQSTWQTLPPLTSILAIQNVIREGRVLATVRPSDTNLNSLPSIVSGKYGSGKIMVMPVDGLWRWRLMMEGAGKNGEFFGGFITGMLRWLTTEIGTSPLVINTGTDSYLSGQEIAFEGRLFDSMFSPVSGAIISLIVDNDSALKVILEETAPSLYTGTLRSIASGTHTFSAEAVVEGSRVADTAGQFNVEEFSLDMLDTGTDPEVMGAIANRTGGISVTAAGIDSVLSIIHPEFISERQEEERHLYLSPIFPVIIISLLATEWIIRKRRGMI